MWGGLRRDLSNSRRYISRNIKKNKQQNIDFYNRFVVDVFVRGVLFLRLFQIEFSANKAVYDCERFCGNVDLL